MTTTKPLKPFFQLVCLLFNPLLLLTYVTMMLCLLAPFELLPAKHQYIFVGTVALPLLIVWLMYFFKVIGDWRMSDRRDRVIPYLAILICYGVNAVLLRHLHFLSPVSFMLFNASLVVIGAVWIINFWWKISSYTAASAILPLYLLFVSALRPDVLPLWAALSSILVVGLLGTARIYLGRHTLAQVSGGVVLGILAFIASMYL